MATIGKKKKPRRAYIIKSLETIIKSGIMSYLTMRLSSNKCKAKTQYIMIFILNLRAAEKALNQIKE
jgi:hypothetical protein